jgi:hypothetical protein
MVRWGVGLTVSALSTALLVPIGIAPAGGAPVEASGSIACDWTVGKATFRPRFVDGGSEHGLVTFRGRLGSCRDATGEGGPTPSGITGARVKGSFLTLVNSCTTGSPFIGADGEVAIKWTGPQRVAPTRFRSDGSSYQLDAEGGFFSLPADGINGTGEVAGSFAGTAGAVFGTAEETGERIGRACTRKTRGLPGSGGVKRLTMNDSLAVLFTS